jgi:hypothetical protein
LNYCGATAALGALARLTGGCGGGNAAVTAPDPLLAPAIATQPFVAAQGDMQGISMQQQGYANVAVTVNFAATDPYTFLFER